MNTNRRGFFGACAAAMSWMCAKPEASGPLGKGSDRCIMVRSEQLAEHLWKVTLEYDKGPGTIYLPNAWMPKWASECLNKPRSHVEFVTMSFFPRIA